VKNDTRIRQESVNWVEKLARQDWSAFQNGDLGCIIAVARRTLWDELTSECREIVNSYEQEYLRRIFWNVESPQPPDGETSDQTVHRATIIEKANPDRLLFELRFDTSLPAIYFCALEPFETSGVISLVLDDAAEVRLCYRGVLMTPRELAKILLAPVLFRLNVHFPGLSEDPVDLARIRGAYGEGTLLNRRHVSGSRSPSLSRAPDFPPPPKPITWLAALDVSRPAWVRYVLATVVVMIATGLVFLAQSLTAVPIFWLLSGAIVFSFVQWGIGPGLVALLIGIVNTDYFFVEPLYELDFGSTTRLLGLAYALMAFSAYWLSTRHRQDATS
jgi:hypothetical protein